MKRKTVIIPALCMALLLTACGSSESAKTGQSSGQAESGGGQETSQGAQPAGESKDTLIVGAAQEPDAFFPFNLANTTSMDEVPILHNVYETPLKLSPDGVCEPLLAERCEISEDGKDYTLYLRDDVYFHNGKKMTAQDVAGSLNLAAEDPDGKTLLSNYDTTEVIDDRTVVVHLTAPYAPFLNSLTSRYALIVDVDLYNEIGADGYEKTPIGTGPYKFVERVAGDHIQLQANDEYWGGKPAFANINYKILTDSNTQILALENGEIDVLLNTNISPLLKLPADGDIKYLVCEASSIMAVGINTTKGPGQNLDFRKAVQSAINKDEIILGTYEGEAQPTDIFMAKSFSGYPNEEELETVPYDVEKAKEYLAASGYNGEEFMLVAQSGTKNETVAQIIQGQLIELGINCTVNALDASSYTALVQGGDGDYGAYVRAGGVSVLDADGLYNYFSETAYHAERYNPGWTSPEMQKLLDDGRVEVNPDKRSEIYTQVCNKITEQAFQLPIYCDLSVVAFNKEIQGIQPRSLVGLYYFNEWH